MESKLCIFCEAEETENVEYCSDCEAYVRQMEEADKDREFDEKCAMGYV